MSLRTMHTRETLEQIRRADPPEPRAAFIADLEAQLIDLTQAASTADVLPEIELAPPVAVHPTPHGRVWLTVGAVAACAAVLLGALATAPARFPAEVRSAAARDHLGEDASVDGHNGDGTASRSAAGDGADGDGIAGGYVAAARPTTSMPPTAAPVESNSAAADQAERSEMIAGVAGRDEIALRVSGTAARIGLEWDRYAHDDFAAYLVLRASDPDEPEYRDTSGRTHVLLRIENRDAVRHEDSPQLGTTPRYRIVVVGRDGRELARSAAVSPDNPLDAPARLGGLAGDVATPS